MFEDIEVEGFCRKDHEQMALVFLNGNSFYFPLKTGLILCHYWFLARLSIASSSLPH